MPKAEKTTPVELTADQQKLIKTAVADGQKQIANGETKIAAAMTIYRALEALDQETVTQALIDGASLTPKGAQTYWYTCKRKLAKEKSQSAK